MVFLIPKEYRLIFSTLVVVSSQKNEGGFKAYFYLVMCQQAVFAYTFVSKLWNFGMGYSCRNLHESVTTTAKESYSNN